MLRDQITAPPLNLNIAPFYHLLFGSHLNNQPKISQALSELLRSLLVLEGSAGIYVKKVTRKSARLGKAILGKHVPASRKNMDIAFPYDYYSEEAPK